MAHSKSAEKRIRQNAARRLRNRGAKSAQRTSVKKVHAALATEDATAAAKALHSAQKRIDSNVAKGIVRKRTASRIKSSLARKLNAIEGAKAE
ncbi:MAG: 30S ribosomal protein S20 [Acidobacteriota bacterium]